MGWAFFYMFVILKIPLLMALWLVWWSVKDEVPVDEDPGGGGSDRAEPDHPRPRRPRPPRRGPHAGPRPAPPKRIRAHGRRLQPAHGRPA
jgi:hypothetical protein